MSETTQRERLVEKELRRRYGNPPNGRLCEAAYGWGDMEPWCNDCLALAAADLLSDGGRATTGERGHDFVERSGDESWQRWKYCRRCGMSKRFANHVGSRRCSPVQPTTE